MNRSIEGGGCTRLLATQDSEELLLCEPGAIHVRSIRQFDLKDITRSTATAVRPYTSALKSTSTTHNQEKLAGWRRQQEQCR